MPLLKLETNVALDEDRRQALLNDLSRLVVETMHKPYEYVMVSIAPAAMLMSEKIGDAAFVDLRSIGGLNDAINRQLSKKICHLLNQSLGIKPDRIYLNFTDVPAGNWGHNGETFG